MNVLMIVTWYTRQGAPCLQDGVFHHEQSRALIEQGANVALYYPFDPAIAEAFTAGEEWGLMTYRTRAGKGRWARTIRDFRRICKEFRPDILHAHVASGAGVVAAVLSRMFGIPYVITEHNPVELYGLDNPKIRLMTGAAYHFSRANLCVSRDSMEKMQQVFPKEHFEIVYNATQNPANLALPDGKVTVDGRVNCCIIAAFYSQTIKGYQYLLPAVAKLKQQGVALMLHIVGGGEFLPYYRNMAKELEIEDCCIFYGSCPREQVYSILQQMDFSISASIFECSGVSVQEAMLLGKPLVVTRSGGANSLTTEDTAIVVDKESVDALAEGIGRMIRERRCFDDEKIKAYAYENFEITNVTRRYLEIYRQALEGK